MHQAGISIPAVPAGCVPAQCRCSALADATKQLAQQAHLYVVHVDHTRGHTGNQLGVVLGVGSHCLQVVQQVAAVQRGTGCA